MPMNVRSARAIAMGLLVTSALFVSAGVAAAQSASSSFSGFSKSASSYEAPINVATRDANGNMEIVDGVMQSPAGSIFSNLASSGVSSSTATSGAGVVASGQAVAIGNNLNVSVSGNYNTVIVNSSQTNTGAVSASTVLNGKVNLDDAQ
jgi:holdfast attachment protein HfaA